MRNLRIASPIQKLQTILGQALWDFYRYQVHVLKKVHADPHPGNFLVNEKNQLVALDFGCIKKTPDGFYTPYFELINKEVIDNKQTFNAKLFDRFFYAILNNFLIN